MVLQPLGKAVGVFGSSGEEGVGRSAFCFGYCSCEVCVERIWVCADGFKEIVEVLGRIGGIDV